MTDKLRSCLNCGTPLQGCFCHHCGQKDQERRVRLGHLLKEMFGELLNYDHKVLSSFWLLVRRPGFLAQEYLDGRRVRHLSPFRLYVVMSFLTFFLFSLVPTDQHRKDGAKPGQVKVNLQVEAGDGPEAAGEVAAAKAKRPQPAGEAAAAKAKRPQPAWVTALKARAKGAKADPDRFKQAFLTNLSRALFLLMPFFALLLFLLHLRRRTLFMEHMVLSLHYHAFSFLVILALMGLALLPGDDWGTWPGTVLFFLPPVYLAIALQRLHGRGWLRSALKSAIASFVYGLTLSAALLGLLYFSLPAVR